MRSLARTGLHAAALVVALLSGCDEGDDTSAGASLDAGDDASTGALLDAGDAGKDTSTGLGCYSPVSRRSSDGLEYCSCAATPVNSRGYCIRGAALFCNSEKNSWQEDADGPCSPAPLGFDPAQSCPVGGTVSTRCPSGFQEYMATRRFDDDAGPRTKTCCLPIEVSADNCNQAGSDVLAATPGKARIDDTCSNGGSVAGFVTDTKSPSLCCSGPKAVP